jgi:AcrR family transcriptional regulator
MARGLSQKAHQKVLDAAAALFADHGIDKTSMDAIAASAAVSKATVYKHWADKDALCLEVLLHIHRLDEVPKVPHSADLKRDMKVYLAYEEPNPERAAVRSRIMPHLIAYSARNEQFGRAWRARVSGHTQAGIRELLRRGIKQGIFPAVLDEDLSIAMLVGPLMYLHIFGLAIGRERLIIGVVDAFWKAHARAIPTAAKKSKRSH